MTSFSGRTLLGFDPAHPPSIRRSGTLGDPHPAGEPWAGVLSTNPLAGAFTPNALPDHAERLVLPSGWLPGDDPDAPDFRTWTPAGWRAFDEFTDALSPHLAGRKAIFLPHARHVLSDPQACLNAIRRWQERPGLAPFALLVEPAAFLTPSMLSAAEDHLFRAFEALTHPRSLARPFVAGVVLSNVAAGPTGGGLEEPPLALAPLDGGLLDPALILRAFGRCADPALPVVLRPPEITRQAGEILRDAGEHAPR